ncbi:MAG: hypothetical protein K2N51_17145 [Lachnospiraceae bacterium]|nr:hypothetical protein [Lachnospiraceae bacterium]
MFDTCITLFNYDASEDTYYGTLIDYTEFQPIYKTEPNVMGTENKTSCLVIIPYTSKKGVIYITSGDTKQYYVPPKEWEKRSNKVDCFTFQTDTDFIIKGNKNDLTDVNLNDMKNNFDNVFVINQVKDFDKWFIQHFELTVN